MILLVPIRLMGSCRIQNNSSFIYISSLFLNHSIDAPGILRSISILRTFVSFESHLLQGAVNC